MRYAFFIGIVFLIGCSKQTKPSSLSPEEDFSKGMEYFEKGKYDKALEVFSNFFTEHPGSRYLDRVQYYLAECYFKKKDYERALDEFEFLINNFPGSSFLEKAYLRKAQCLYHLSPIPQRDQEITKKAIDAYDVFLLKFPHSDMKEIAEKEKADLVAKLDKKDLEIAIIYMKMGKYKSALIYLEKLAGKESRFRDEVFYRMGECYEKLGDVENAIKAYKLVEGNWKEKAQKKLKKLQ